MQPKKLFVTMPKRLLSISLLLFSMSLLWVSGCHSDTSVLTRQPLTFHKLSHHSAVFPKNRSDTTLLENNLSWLTAQHITVSLLNHQVRIVIPTDPFFDIKDYHKKPIYLPVMQRISWMLKKYVPCHDIMITGHTDGVMSPARQRSISYHLANQTAALLWQYGIHRKYIHVKGLGNQYPWVESKGRYYNASHLNRRIEIHIQQCPKNLPF